MKKIYFATFIFVLSISLLQVQQMKAQELSKPPYAKIIPKELEIHGDKRIDNYYWLNERENPEVINYLKAENNYTADVLKNAESLQEKLFEELKGRIKQTDESVPYFSNGYYYYLRFEEGKEYPVYCRKKSSLNADEEILLNVNEMAEGFDYYSVGGISVSPDNKMLAFGVDTLSRFIYEIKFKDLTTGAILTESIPNTTGSSVWANDNKTIFYSIKDEALRPYKIIKHKLGTYVKTDTEVFHENDPLFSVTVAKSKSKKYIGIVSYSITSSEYRFVDADEPDGEFKVFHQRENDLLYSVEHSGNKFYVTTNLDAINFRLMETEINKTTKENWKELIPHRKDVLLEDMEVFKDFIVLTERKNGLTQIRIMDTKNNTGHYLDFGEQTYSANLSINREYDFDILRYSYSSLTTPTSTFDYNMVTKEKTLMKQQEVLGEFNKDEYYAERHYAIAGDGEKIPISLVYKKGFDRKGNVPLLLYGYGSYGFSTDAAFSTNRLSLLDRGFVYAIAHIRGGQEMGRYWYEDGKLLKKKNTFTDFIACAEYLIKEKYTSPEKLFAMGGSAGGLLVGAVVNMRPDLFKGIIASVPFVDVVTTMLDESIPLTTGEYVEWGNPNEKEYYEYMLSYSPYDNVEKKDYPAMLVMTGLHDSQVQYWEPAKWVAKLRIMKTDKNPLLLKTNMDAGHSGSSGRFKSLKDAALMYAFMFSLLDIAD